jgi:hypothetical protein
MESKLQLGNILYCYNTLKKNRETLSTFDVGKHLGYLEAGLDNWDYSETVKVEGESQIKRELKPATKWYKKAKLESYEEAIIRMVEKMFTDKKVEFNKQ